MTPDLGHIFWVGGSPCSGKSSIVKILAERFGWQIYQCDYHFWAHQQRTDPDRHPAFHKLAGMSWDDIWMRPVEVLIEDELAIYHEEFEMIIDDLSNLPTEPPIVAEGAALLPDRVGPIVAGARQAIWVVPTEQFQRTMYPQRGAWVQEILDQCRQPEQAFQNWMDRDVQFSQQVIAQANRRALPLLMVDGRRSIDQNAKIVAEQFGLRL